MKIYHLEHVACLHQSNTSSTSISNPPNEVNILDLFEIGNHQMKMTLHQKLHDLWQKIGLKLAENFIIRTIPKSEDFKPHLTIFKLSRMDFNEQKMKQIRKIPEELYMDKWKNQYFGNQKVNSVQVITYLSALQSAVLHFEV